MTIQIDYVSYELLRIRMYSLRQSQTGYLHMGLAIFLFGTALPASQVLTNEVHVLDGTAIRLTVAAILFLPLIWQRREEVRSISKTDLLFIGLISVSLVAVSGLMLCSTRFAPCSVICSVTCLTPILTAIGGIIFFRDRPHRTQLMWILTAAVSGLILRKTCTSASSTQGELLWMAIGIGFSLLAIFCEAAGILFAKVATRRVSPLTLASLSTVLSVLIILPFAWFNGHSIHLSDLSTQAWIAGIWWGAGGLTLGTWLWYVGIQRSNATTAAAFLCTLPFVTVAISWFVN